MALCLIYIIQQRISLHFLPKSLIKISVDLFLKLLLIKNKNQKAVPDLPLYLRSSFIMI